MSLAMNEIGLSETYYGVPSRSVLAEAAADGAVGPPPLHRNGPKRWSVVLLSILSSAIFMACVGCLCAFIYPILKELRAGTVRGVDGNEERILGFWSILLLSMLVGSTCCFFSWILTYMDMYQTGSVLPSSLGLAHFRDASGHRSHMGYGVVVLNGVMAMLTVIWSLS